MCSNPGGVLSSTLRSAFSEGVLLSAFSRAASSLDKSRVSVAQGNEDEARHRSRFRVESRYEAPAVLNPDARLRSTQR